MPEPAQQREWLPVVLTCQDCHHTWEPDLPGVRDLLWDGCPRCGGWAWAGELGASTTPTSNGGRAGA